MATNSPPLVAQTPNGPVERFVSYRVLASTLGLSRATVVREVARGALPKPVRLSAGRVGFKVTDVMDVLAKREDPA